MATRVKSSNKSLLNKDLLVKLGILIISILLTLPMIIADIMMATGLHNGFSMFFMNPMYGLFSSCIIGFGFGYNYFSNTYYEIFKWKKIGMNTLISITVTLAMCWSFYQLIDNSIHNGFLNIISLNWNGNEEFVYFFEIPCALVTILKIGDWINSFLKNKLKKDQDEIKQLISQEFNYYDLKSKKIVTKNIKELKINDYVYVKPNEKIPVDGLLYSNACSIDESFITGEVTSVNKKKGNQIYGGSVNLGESFILQANVEAKNTLLNQIVKKLRIIQSKKGKIQNTIDIIAQWFTPIILTVGILCFIVMLFFGYDIQNAIGLENFSFIPHFEKWTSYNIVNNNQDIIEQNLRCSFYFMIATIVVSCPCALGIAAPLGIIIGTSKASKSGVIFNDIDVFENVKKIDMIALDKTGTLTIGKISVTKIIGDKKYLNILCGMEQHLNHPISNSVVEYLQSNLNIKPTKIPKINSISNDTFEYTNKSQKYIITSLKSNFYKKAIKDKKLLKLYEEEINLINIKTSFAFIHNNKIVNYFILSDQLRPEAKRFIEMIKEYKIEPIVITGDTMENSEFLKKELGIEKIYAGTNPFDKEKIISEFQNQGKYVAYVGDGLNDLMALQKSDLSFNISTNISFTDNVSHITLLDNNLLNICKSIKLAKYTKNIIKWNLIWSFSYNAIIIPIAFLGIIPALFSMIAMLFSDVMLSINSIIRSYKNPIKDIK